jgi:hypothetical protein
MAAIANQRPSLLSAVGRANVVQNCSQGGIAVDPGQLSAAKLERLTRVFTN